MLKTHEKVTHTHAHTNKKTKLTIEEPQRQQQQQNKKKLELGTLQVPVRLAKEKLPIQITRFNRVQIDHGHLNLRVEPFRSLTVARTKKNKKKQDKKKRKKRKKRKKKKKKRRLFFPFQSKT